MNEPMLGPAASEYFTSLESNPEHEIWPDLSSQVRRQIDTLVADLLRLTGNSIVGIYLHGSLAFGCTHSESRDIDLLVVTKNRLDTNIKRRILSLLIERSLSPCSIELTVLSKTQLWPWQHPCAYDLHFGEDWRDQISRALHNSELTSMERGDSRDIYLAVHITNTVQRGQCLFGQPAAEVFPTVPHGHYKDFLVQHLLWGLEATPFFPIYAVLTACRALAFFRHGLVLSKQEGALWACTVLPSRFHSTITDALEGYQSPEKDQSMGTARVRAIVKYVAESVGAPSQVTPGTYKFSAAGNCGNNVTPVPS